MSEIYNTIEQLCVDRGHTITKMCRDLAIPRSVLSELKAGRTKTLSGKYLSTIAEYFKVSADYLLGSEEKPAAKISSGHPEDEFVGFYGEVKKDLTKDDLDDIKKLMEIRAELNRSKGK